MRAVGRGADDPPAALSARLEPETDACGDPFTIWGPGGVERASETLRDHRGVDERGIHVIKGEVFIGAVGVHGDDGGITQLFLRDGEDVLVGELREDVREAVLPVRVPAVQLFLHGPDGPGGLLVDDLRTIRGPTRGTHGYISGVDIPASSGMNPFPSTTLVEIPNRLIVNILRKDLNTSPLHFNPSIPPGLKIHRNNTRIRRVNRLRPVRVPRILPRHLIKHHPLPIPRPLRRPHRPLRLTRQPSQPRPIAPDSIDR